MAKEKKAKRYRWFMLILAVLLFLGISVFLYRRDKTKEEVEREDIHLLISLDDDSGNKAVYDTMIEEYNNRYEDKQLIPFYVASDTEAILKLVYSGYANQRYDIAVLGAQQLHTLSGMDLIVPLDDYVLRSKGLDWLGEIKPIMMAQAMKEGELISLPLIRNAMVLYYNKNNSIVTKNSVTLQDLLEIAKAGMMMPLERVMLEALASQPSYHQHKQSNYGSYLSFDSNDKIELVKQYQKALSENNLINYSENGLYGIEDFMKGNVNYLVASTYYYHDIMDIIEFEFGCIPIKLEDQMTFPLQGSNLYMINQKNADLHEKSWEVMESLADYIYSNEELANLNHLAVKHGQKLKTTKESKQEILLFEKINSYSYNGYSGMAVKQNAKVKLLMDSMLRNIFRRMDDPEIVIPQMNEQINEILQQ